MFDGTFLSTIDPGKSLLYLLCLLAPIIVIAWLLRDRIRISWGVYDGTPSTGEPSWGNHYRLTWHRRPEKPEQGVPPASDDAANPRG